MKTPNTTEHDLRCKGTKDDLELARDWITLNDNPLFSIVCQRADGSFCEIDNQKSLEAIEKELGKERLEFLVFKIETEERMEKLERKNEASLTYSSAAGDYKIDLKNVDPDFTPRIECGGNLFVNRKPWYKRLLGMQVNFTDTAISAVIFAVLWFFLLILLKV
jgi:hypothetical protein